jgi:hypothetical protein
MNRLLLTSLILVGSTSLSVVFAQDTTPADSKVKVTTRREVCVEKRNDLLPMATLGTVPANAKFVGNIAPDKVYYCESAKSAVQAVAAPAEAPAPVMRAPKPRRRMAEPKR